MASGWLIPLPWVLPFFECCWAYQLMTTNQNMAEVIMWHLTSTFDIVKQSGFCFPVFLVHALSLSLISPWNCHALSQLRGKPYKHHMNELLSWPSCPTHRATGWEDELLSLIVTLRDSLSLRHPNNLHSGFWSMEWFQLLSIRRLLLHSNSQLLQLPSTSLNISFMKKFWRPCLHNVKENHCAPGYFWGSANKWQPITSQFKTWAIQHRHRWLSCNTGGGGY